MFKIDKLNVKINDIDKDILKDFMKEEEFINCVEGLEKLYEE